MGVTSGHTLTFLGTADSKGVPRFWCNCAVCAEARTSGVNRRTRTAHLLRGGGEVALLDAGADLHAQLARIGGPLVPDAVLISHAHNDHILGLADLLDFVRYVEGKLTIYAPQSVLPQLQDRFSYAFRASMPVQAIPPGGVEVAGHRIRLFEVPHGANGTSYAYRLERPGWAGVIMTDAIDVPDELAGAELNHLDFLVLGTSFVDESGVPHSGRSIYDLREAFALPWARSARSVYLSHLSHDVDVRATSLPSGWAFAHDGLTVQL